MTNLRPLSIALGSGDTLRYTWSDQDGWKHTEFRLGSVPKELHAVFLGALQAAGVAVDFDGDQVDGFLLDIATKHKFAPGVIAHW